MIRTHKKHTLSIRTHKKHTMESVRLVFSQIIGSHRQDNYPNLSYYEHFLT